MFRSDDPAKALKSREARQITLDDAAKTVSELEHEKALKGLITVEGKVDVATTSVRPLRLLTHHLCQICLNHNKGVRNPHFPRERLAVSSIFNDPLIY